MINLFETNGITAVLLLVIFIRWAFYEAREIKDLIFKKKESEKE